RHLGLVACTRRGTGSSASCLRTGWPRRNPAKSPTNQRSPPMPSLSIPDLAGKAILVTGASTGIGAALARAYAEQKAKVGLHYNESREAAEKLATEIGKAGGDVFLVQGDFAKSADVARVVEDTAKHFGRLDGLVNNAGGMLGRVP